MASDQSSVTLDTLMHFQLQLAIAKQMGKPTESLQSIVDALEAQDVVPDNERQ